MAVIDIVTALARIIPQMHGVLDVATALSAVWAIRQHDQRKAGTSPAQYAADYERTMRSFREAAAAASQGRDGGRAGRSA